MTDSLPASRTSIAAATALREAGRFDDALALLGPYLASRPDDAQALALAVHILLLSGRTPEAQAALARALAVAPSHPDVLRSQARVSLKLGQPAEAQAAALAAYRADPNQPETCLVLGASLSALKQDAPALQLVEAALALNPRFAEAFANRAMLRQRAGDAAGGLADAEQAIVLKPHMAQLWSLASGFRHREGNLAGAIEALQEAARLEPRAASHRIVLGEFLRLAGRLDEAIATLEEAVTLAPADGNAWINYGTALHESNQLDRARSAYERARALNPGSAVLANNLGSLATSHWHLGNALSQDRRFDEAIASFQSAIELDPQRPETHLNQGVALQQMERFEAAAAAYQRAIALRPDSLNAHNNLGAALRALGRFAESEASCRRAIEIDARSAQAHANLCDTLAAMKRYDESEAIGRRAIELDPELPEAHANLGSTLADMGRPADSLQHFRRAFALRPSMRHAQTNLLFNMGFCGVGAPAEYLQEARAWEKAVFTGGDQPRGALDMRRAPRHGRRLRVGYLSGDLRTHPVAKFVEPLFALHDRTRVEVIAYSNATLEDAVTARLRATADGWKSVVGLGYRAAADMIDADGIDVLIDLAGHTRHDRLDIVARRAAPVQAHYVGYFASTGVSQMDYWIGDGVITPPAHDEQFTEQVWRLPRVWMSYQPQEHVPPTAWTPPADGVIRFGSFNNLKKVTPRTIALWSRVLHAVPESVLVLKTAELDAPVNRARIEGEFAAHGIVAARLSLLGKTPSAAAHMAAYDLLDVVLDPVGGIGGVTTTCDGLWMGVPVIVFAGDRTTMRMSAALLHGVGHPEWVAESEEEYVNKAVVLARDVELRARLRPAQRDLMRASPLCDGAGLARSLEDAYEAMFDRCAARLA
ncbi:MAG: tetratricopeptide repeat protein [Pseudomonadota bacterium]